MIKLKIRHIIKIIRRKNFVDSVEAFFGEEVQYFCIDFKSKKICFNSLKFGFFFSLILNVYVPQK